LTIILKEEGEEVGHHRDGRFSSSARKSERSEVAVDYDCILSFSAVILLFVRMTLDKMQLSGGHLLSQLLICIRQRKQHCSMGMAGWSGLVSTLYTW
jgi:hypothetical protein